MYVYFFRLTINSVTNFFFVILAHLVAKNSLFHPSLIVCYNVAVKVIIVIDTNRL